LHLVGCNLELYYDAGTYEYEIMEKVVKDLHFFLNMQLGHHLPVKQLVSFLE
jgi:hypothetical protein